MEKRYKFTMFSRTLYREIELPPDAKSVRIGTRMGCDVRMNRDFADYEIILEQREGEWIITASESICFSFDNNKKLTASLQHGDLFCVRYEKNTAEMFSCRFTIDFDYEKHAYDLEIDISKAAEVTVSGKANSQIFISSQYINDDCVILRRADGSTALESRDSVYGVMHNGKNVQGTVMLEDHDFFSIADFSFCYQDGKLYTDSEKPLQCTAFPTVRLPRDRDYPKFHRNTRIKTEVSEEPISILDPPQKPAEPKNKLLTSLIPSLAMLAMIILLRGVMGGGGMYVIFSACSMAIGIGTSIFNYFNGKKEYRQSVADRKEKYTKYIEQKKQEIEALREQERSALQKVYPSPERERAMLTEFSAELFDRQADDADFLDVRLGLGDVPARRVIEYKEQERLEIDDELLPLPKEVAETYRMIAQIPVICRMKECSAVGIVGSDSALYEMLKVMICDLCVRQYHTDLRLCFTLSDDPKYRWLRMLPHVGNDELGIRSIVCDERSKNVIFEYLYKELSARETSKRTAPHIAVFVCADYGITSHPISRFIGTAKDLGVTFVFLENEKRMIPQHCDRIIFLDSDSNTGTLVSSENENDAQRFTYHQLSESYVQYASMRLAPVYSDEISLESTLTRNISLFQLLGIVAAKDLDLDALWRNSDVSRSMSAPIGVRKGNETVFLDLHDKFHGPHGLVAGTTGSGKSELLQTYILSMAARFHPYEVSFLIIDFKGGGMVNQFLALPHLVGSITNIDGREIERSLKSIKAELRKRQRLFAESEVNHIDKYIQKYHRKEVREPLPHLIVIVDEFAELKAEQPEFMGELISAARIGRSLGVHLILATQKPAGQVNEQIWSNSRFRLCLKVQSQNDSNEVLKSPLAAEIKEPGRAYLQVGNNEIFELFQSAYSGGPEKADEASRVREFCVSRLSLSGQRETVYEQRNPKQEGSDSTQLNAIVSYIKEHCEKAGIPKLPDICLPSLPETIFVDAFAEQSESGMRCEIGMYDDPDNQYQGIVSYELGAQNTMIIGSSQFGKTNLLQWIIRNLASKYSPAELNLYILDFGSMVLTNFEPLRHVGGVVRASEDEKFNNLFKLLNEEISTRKEKLVAAGVSSFSSYKEAGHSDLPQIIVMVDNLTALKELYLNVDNDPLLYLCREGSAVGISVIAANAQLHGIGYKYLSSFANKIALYCNDAGEYSSLFGSCRVRPAAVPGRAIIEIEKDYYECQTYLAFEGEKEYQRVAKIKTFIESINGKYPREKAKVIPVIPDVLNTEYIERSYGLPEQPYHVTVGLNYRDVSCVTLDISTLPVLALSGKPGGGKGNLIRLICQALEDGSAPVEVAVADDVSRKFADLKELDIVRTYMFMPDDIKELIRKWHGILQARFDSLTNSTGDPDSEPLLLLIVQNNDVHSAISGDPEILKLFQEMIGRFRGMKFCVIFSDLENAQIPYSSPETMRLLRDRKHFVLFDDIPNIKVTDMPLPAIRQFKKPLGRGDAYYMINNEVIKLKTVLAPQNENRRTT